MNAYAERISVEELFVDEDDTQELLTMQVRTDSSLWHRVAVGRKFTACGESLPVGSRRHESYQGHLCPECFTPFELTENVRVNCEEIEGEP